MPGSSRLGARAGCGPRAATVIGGSGSCLAGQTWRKKRATRAVRAVLPAAEQAHHDHRTGCGVLAHAGGREGARAGVHSGGLDYLSRFSERGQRRRVPLPMRSRGDASTASSFREKQKTTLRD